MDELIEFLKIEHNLNLLQIRLLRVLIEQVVQSPRYAEEFEKGDFNFLNNQPFASYGGTGAYISAFGEEIKPIFFYIRQSHSFKLARMR